VLWRTGYRDEFLAGPDGLDPDGNRHDDDPALLGHADYRAGRRPAGPTASTLT